MKIFWYHPQMMNKHIILAALILSSCTGSSLSDESTHDSASETIRIGYIGPITGDASSFGADTLNGARMAVEEINESGGINGKMVSLIAEDGRCSGSDSEAAAMKLTQLDGVAGIIGGHCSSETLAAAPIVEEAQIPMISPLSSSPDITHAGDFVFRVYPSDALKGKALARYFDDSGFKRVAIISENTDFCLGVKDVAIAALADDTECICDEVVEPGTKDYKTALIELNKKEFDVFLANGQSPTTVAAMATQMRELGLEQPIVSTDAADSVTLGHIARDAVEGLRALSVPSLSPEDPEATTFINTFDGKYRTPEVGYFFAALSYEATKLLLAAINEVGTDGETLRDELYAHPGYETLVGTISFDEYGDVKGIPFALKEFQDGKLVEVERIPLE